MDLRNLPGKNPFYPRGIRHKSIYCDPSEYRPCKVQPECSPHEVHPLSKTQKYSVIKKKKQIQNFRYNRVRFPGHFPIRWQCRACCWPANKSEPEGTPERSTGSNRRLRWLATEWCRCPAETDCTSGGRRRRKRCASVPAANGTTAGAFPVALHNDVSPICKSLKSSRSIQSFLWGGGFKFTSENSGRLSKSIDRWVENRRRWLCRHERWPQSTAKRPLNFPDRRQSYR